MLRRVVLRTDLGGLPRTVGMLVRPAAGRIAIAAVLAQVPTVAPVLLPVPPQLPAVASAVAPVATQRPAIAPRRRRIPIPPILTKVLAVLTGPAPVAPELPAIPAGLAAVVPSLRPVPIHVGAAAIG